MECSMPNSPVLHYLSEFAQIHVHWVKDAISILPSIFLSIRVFYKELVLHIRWLKFWNCSFSLPMNIQDWSPLGLTGLISLTLKSLIQHHSSKASILQHSVFFMVQLSYPFMSTGKMIALTIWTFVSKMMPLLFNTLSRFVIAFLPRSNCLLISWLQSPSVVMLKPKKRKPVTASTFPPCHEVMGLDAMILVFWMLNLSLLFHSPLSCLLCGSFSSSSFSAIREELSA